MTATGDALATRDFNRLRELIYTESGIHLSAEKRTMLEIRIKRRLRTLNIPSYTDYCNYVFDPAGRESELVQLIDCVTTNKTDFFRESGHFDFLVAKALPELAERNRAKKVLAWSAGCSSGEEPYTLAMVLAEYARTHPGLQYSILATDICTEVLEKARRGIFKQEVAAPVPQELRRRYFMRSRDRASPLLRVVPELRSQVEFRRLNFMDTDFGLSEPMHLIFCRNVIIYFDRATQTRILEKLTGHLAPGGFFFAGHSESLQGMALPLVAVGQSVYRKVASWN